MNRVAHWVVCVMLAAAACGCGMRAGAPTTTTPMPAPKLTAGTSLTVTFPDLPRTYYPMQTHEDALGKVDEYGQVTEDLRGQVLGQLAERISYDQLYQDAVRDPTLKRTKQELEVALENAKLARNVVFQLFQDLETFNLEDYRKFDDGGAGMNRLLAFARECAATADAALRQVRENVYEVKLPNDGMHVFTTNRQLAKDSDDLGLLGLEHPLVRTMLGNNRALPPRDRALMGRIERFAGQPCVLSVWRVEIHGTNGYFRQAIVPLAVDSAGHRLSTGDAMLNGLRDINRR